MSADHLPVQRSDRGNCSWSFHICCGCNLHYHSPYSGNPLPWTHNTLSCRGLGTGITCLQRPFESISDDGRWKVMTRCFTSQLTCMTLQELNAFLTPITKSEMVVDRSLHDEQLRINFNISFPSLPCEFATLDVSDALGLVGLLQTFSFIYLFDE